MDNKITDILRLFQGSSLCKFAGGSNLTAGEEFLLFFSPGEFLNCLTDVAFFA